MSFNLPSLSPENLVIQLIGRVFFRWIDHRFYAQSLSFHVKHTRPLINPTYDSISVLYRVSVWMRKKQPALVWISQVVKLQSRTGPVRITLHTIRRDPITIANVGCCITLSFHPPPSHHHSRSFHVWMEFGDTLVRDVQIRWSFWFICILTSQVADFIH